MGQQLANDREPQPWDYEFPPVDAYNDNDDESAPPGPVSRPAPKVSRPVIDVPTQAPKDIRLFAGPLPANLGADKPARDYLPPTADVRDGLYILAPLTEAGNASRMVLLYGDRIRYIPETKSWLIWDDAGGAGHWVHDVDGAMVRRLATGLATSLYTEAGQHLLDAKFIVEWARKSQSKTTVDHTIALLSDRAEIRISFALVDGNPFLIGLDGAKQVIDLHTGLARSAERADLVTKSLGCSNIGSVARAGRWSKFINQIFQDDPALIGWVHRFLGYMLTGSVKEEVFVFCHGGGANGKSVLIKTISAIMGDYCRTIQPESLMVQNRNSGSASSDLARLAGARLVVGNETEAGRPLAEAMIKMLTGEDNITARELYKGEMEFEPALKLVLAGNHKPVIRGTDPAIWRRVRLLPFAVEFRMGNKTSPSDARPIADRDLLSKLNAERDDILACLIKACIEWQRDGLGDTPDVMHVAVEDYKAEQDVLGQWIADLTDASGATLAADLYRNYKSWAEDCGIRPVTLQAFGRQLGERGYRKTHIRRGWEYAGISLHGSDVGPF
jgi:P4 family phage/plasmid primase-like protien